MLARQLWEKTLCPYILLGNQQFYENLKNNKTKKVDSCYDLNACIPSR